MSIAVSTHILKDICGSYSPQITAIKTGRNSRVWQVTGAKRSCIVKKYHQSSHDLRDRLCVEFGFLNFLWTNNIRTIPQPLNCFPEENVGVYSYIKGVPIKKVSLSLVGAAAQFIINLCKLQCNPDALCLPVASEACQCIEDHVAHVNIRLNRLKAIKPDTSKWHHHCVSFVQDVLIPRFEKEKREIEKQFDFKERNRRLSINDMILSPSDFGFHNALDTEAGLFFFDFEYAGWDDPLKMLCDFACQPDVPISSNDFYHFQEGICSVLKKKIKERIPYLLPICRLKWCCIFLNEFLGDHVLDRRKHAMGGQAPAFEAQLSKSKKYFTHYLEND